MTDENKYYTPSQEEFHPGFEYEQFDDYDTQPEKTWHKFQWGEKGSMNPESLTYPLGDMKNIRVKYLDAEDIEALGWINKQEYANAEEDVFHFGKEEEGTLKLIMWRDRIFKRIKICHAYSYGLLVYFLGYIKNKSELRRLMRQLGIGE